MGYVKMAGPGFVPFNVSNSKRNWAKFGIGVKLIVILRHIIAYFSINIRWHSQNVSSDSRQWLIKHLFPPSSCKKQINKQNSYLLLAFLQYGSVPELGNDHLTWKGGGGLWFFSKKIFWFSMLLKKYSDFGGGKKNNLIQSFCHIT
jgi:hypothetical protein